MTTSPSSRPPLRPPQAPAEKAPQPSPQPAGQGRTVNEDEVRSRWAEFTAEVSRRKITLGAVLSGATFLGVSNGTIRVECVDEFQVSSIQHSREVLGEIIQSVFSARGTMQGELAAGHSAPAVKEEHPFVQTLKRELGAEPL